MATDASKKTGPAHDPADPAASQAPIEAASPILPPAAPSRAGERTVTDGAASMGIATTRELERVAAAMGVLEAAPLRFESADDLPDGGTLCALPALLAFGLLGLERIPKVRTLRGKIAHLSESREKIARWSASLARSWVERDEAHIIGTLLVDGHTRVYHGSCAKLPKRYISRERLCLRATTDYWVNALDGAPLFCVSKPVDPGLQQTLENDIIPRLLEELPGHPDEAQLAADPMLHRFTIVFDREGYSPALFARLKEKRIAILTYHKHPGEDWHIAEFHEREVTLINGEKVTLKLDERGHPTSLLSTDYRSDLVRCAVAMFARWHQENFFKYMRQHYGLDALVGARHRPTS